jgi:hypothetical protein
LGMTFIDYDHDGDLDLYTNNFQDFPREGANPLELPRDAKSVSSHMWRNNGNGTFTDVTEAVGLGVAVPSIAAIGTDYNNDRATDLLVTQWGRTPIIFQNPREGKFTEVNAWHGTMPATAAGVAVFDFNKDGWMDVAFTHWGAPGLTLWRNVDGKSFEQVSLPTMNWVRCWGVTAFDYDNDGWIDLAAVGETADGRGEIRLFRNMGSKGFKDVSGEVGLSAVQLREPRALIAVDYDSDGATDLLVTQNHGPMKLLRNQGGNKNTYLRIALRGLADNKSGVGTKVEVFAGATRQKWEVQGSSGYLGQSPPEITAGLGGASEADVVRVLWPTGVLQDEIQLASGREQVVSEIDRRGSSCPTLFAWDGKRYQLIGDMIGAGVIGHWVGAGERNVPRPTEYIKVPGNILQQRNGKLSFRLMEPMEEVVYLDHVKLMAVDHPRDVEVYPNEYFASNPPFPAFKVIASRNARPPAGAWDDNKRDLLPDLKAGHYISGFEVLPFKGFTKPHSLELDLGEPYRGGSLRLLLHGLIEYFTATGMYAADQAGIHAISPYVEAMDANGHWVRVIDDMGFPAGLARTMIADLSGRLPVGTQRIRISTNLQIYWDQILIDRTDQEIATKLSAVGLARADLRFHGYPRAIEGAPPGNVGYVYEDVSYTGPYARTPGNYTRYGPVRSLLSRADDRFVVFGSGDEVTLEFDPKSLPELPPNWTRDYFFMADGYEKDMDFYAAKGDSVGPLPFHSMTGYPYPSKEKFPDDQVHLDYLLNYNTREVSGGEPAGYRFAFPKQRR